MPAGVKTPLKCSSVWHNVELEVAFGCPSKRKMDGMKNQHKKITEGTDSEGISPTPAKVWDHPAAVG